MGKSRKTPRGNFGQRNAPKPVLSAPGGIAGAPAPTRQRKMSLTVGLIAAGAVAATGGAIYESHRRAAALEACRAAEAAKPGGGNPAVCYSHSSSSRSYGGGHSSWSSSRSSGSSHSTRSSSSSTSHGVFGGFGRSGSMHFSGS